VVRKEKESSKKEGNGNHFTDFEPKREKNFFGKEVGRGGRHIQIERRRNLNGER